MSLINSHKNTKVELITRLINSTLLSFSLPQQVANTILKICLILAVTYTQATWAAPTLQSLDQLSWQHRIIIVKSSSQDEISQLQSQSEEIDDRDILWFVVDTEAKPINSSDSKTRNTKIIVKTNTTRPLSSEFKQHILKLVDDKQKRVVLIGKDSGIKAQSNALNLSAIFNQIDQMPMRIMEMQQGE